MGWVSARLGGLVFRLAVKYAYRVADARLRGLTLAIPLILLVAVPALAGRDVLLSVWQLDYSITLDTSLRWAYGQVPHIDYRTPIGIAFWIQQGLATELIGIDPRSPILGNALAAAAVIAMAWPLLRRRLRGGLLGLLILAVGLAIVSPRSFGDSPGQISFLAPYNRVGLSLFAVLTASFFIARTGRGGGRWQDFLDGGLAALALFWLFYLKVSFAAIAGAGAVVALHYEPTNRRMIFVGLTGAALAIALVGSLTSINAAYLHDIALTAKAGSAFRVNHFLKGFQQSFVDLLIVVAAVVLYWRSSKAAYATKLSNAVLTVGLVIAGALAMNQVHDACWPLSYLGLLVLAARALRERASAAETRAGEPAGAESFVAPVVGAVILISISFAGDMMSSAFYQKSLYSEGRTRLCADSAAPACRIVYLVAGEGVVERLSPWPSPIKVGSGPAIRPLSISEIIQSCDVAPPCVFWTIHSQLYEMLNRHMTAGDRPYLLGFSNILPYFYQLEPPRHVLAWNDPGRNLSAASHPDPTRAFSDVTLLVVPRVNFGSGFRPGLTSIYANDIPRLFVKVEESDCWEIWRRREGA